MMAAKIAMAMATHVRAGDVSPGRCGSDLASEDFSLSRRGSIMLPTMRGEDDVRTPLLPLTPCTADPARLVSLP